MSLLPCSQKFEEEKPTYKAKMESIESTKEQILEDCDDVLAKTIQSDTSALRKRLDAVADKSFNLNESLRRGARSGIHCAAYYLLRNHNHSWSIK